MLAIKVIALSLIAAAVVVLAIALFYLIKDWLAGGSTS